MLYEDHFREHPEEYEGIRAIKLHSLMIELERARRREEKQKRIEESRRLLREKYSI